MRVTYEDVKRSEEIRTYITQADASLIALGYTEHSFAHVTRCAEVAGANHFGTLHHRKSHFFGGAKFGIVRMNSGGVYDKVNVGSDVIAFLTIQYFHS